MQEQNVRHTISMLFLCYIYIILLTAAASTTKIGHDRAMDMTDIASPMAIVAILCGHSIISICSKMLMCAWILDFYYLLNL